MSVVIFGAAIACSVRPGDGLIDLVPDNNRNV